MLHGRHIGFFFLGLRHDFGQKIGNFQIMFVFEQNKPWNNIW